MHTSYVLGTPGLSVSRQQVKHVRHHAFSGFIVFHSTHHTYGDGPPWERRRMKRTGTEARTTPVVTPERSIRRRGGTHESQAVARRAKAEGRARHRHQGGHLAHTLHRE